MDEITFTPMCVSHELMDLTAIPHRDIPRTDLAIVARYKDGIVTEVIADQKNIPTEEILTRVDDDKPAYLFMPLDEFLGASFGDDPDEPKIYVLGTTNFQFGASVLGYTDELQKVSEALGGGYYILPSSVHEVLVLPDSFGNAMPSEDMQRMVSEINSSEVAENERLSNSVYHFDGENLTVVAGPAAKRDGKE